MKLTDRDRRAILWGSAILAGVLLVRFAILPWWSSWSEARDQTRRCREQMNELELEIRRLANMQDTAVKSYGPSATRPLQGAEAARIAFAKAVNDTLKAGGINFQSITPQRARPLPDLKDVELLPFQVKGKCSLAQLARCLAGMRKAPMPMIVDRIGVSSDPKKPGQLELTMVLSTLAKKEAKRS